ncbi:MAG: hypothetical protein U0Z70_13985 [Thermomicrobiales bacterium]|nr:hypothetical protein [Chloroflexia bacterium]
MTVTPSQDPDTSELAATRRHLIRAAGGMILAASGLAVPAWLEEADARRGALGGARGGRRGKDRRGRHARKDRDHGERKDKHQGKPPGRDIFEPRGVAVFVHNYRSAPVEVQGWRFDHVEPPTPQVPISRDYYIVPTAWRRSPIPARAADGSHSVMEFKTNVLRVAVEIGPDRVVHFRNDPVFAPEASIITGRWDGHGSTGGTVLARSDGLGVHQSISADGIKITRVDDLDDYILFSVDL